MSIVEQDKTTVPVGTWQADVVHSSLGFEVAYMGISRFRGEVKDFEATLTNGRLTGAARIASLETKDENLGAHLQSPEFFDADRHPQVRFASREIVREGDRLEIDGEVTIKGVTRPATLRGTIVGRLADPHGRERIGLELETTIDRTEYGITWNAPMPDGSAALANEVTLEASLSLVAEG
jgi:polyisoprenoid-binding protein YceI